MKGKQRTKARCSFEQKKKKKKKKKNPYQGSGVEFTEN